MNYFLRLLKNPINSSFYPKIISIKRTLFFNKIKIEFNHLLLDTSNISSFKHYRVNYDLNRFIDFYCESILEELKSNDLTLTEIYDPQNVADILIKKVLFSYAPQNLGCGFVYKEKNIDHFNKIYLNSLNKIKKPIRFFVFTNLLPLKKKIQKKGEERFKSWGMNCFLYQ